MCDMCRAVVKILVVEMSWFYFSLVSAKCAQVHVFTMMYILVTYMVKVTPVHSSTHANQSVGGKTGQQEQEIFMANLVRSLNSLFNGRVCIATYCLLVCNSI